MRRSHIPALLVLALCLPGAADASSRGGSSSAAIADAAAVPAAFGGPAASFRELVVDVAREIRSREAERARRRAREEREEFAQLPGGVSIETLTAIAECESGGDPTIVSADGSYRGKYQFATSTWESVGGSGDPAAAPEAEQDYRAALLYAQSGSSPWPVCG